MRGYQHQRGIVRARDRLTITLLSVDATAVPAPTDA